MKENYPLPLSTPPPVAKGSSRFIFRAMFLSLFLLQLINARSQCNYTLPFTETWSATSFTTGCWVSADVVGHADAGGDGEEASNISCTPTECEGGTFPDLNFYGNQCYIENDVLMVYVPVNTTGASKVTFSFLDYFASSQIAGATINMQVLTSTDHVNWHQVWSQQGGVTDIDGSAGVSFTISNSDLNNATTYFAFKASGNEICNLYGWWIDNVSIVQVITPTITGFTPTSGCAGSQTITISGTHLSGATSVKVGGTAVSSITSNSDTSIVVVVGNGTSGPITVVTSLGTATSSTNFTVNTAPATPGNISGPTSICSNSTNTYSIAPVNGATSYTWALPSGWTGSSTADSIVATEGSGGGNISVTANGTCGSSGVKTLTVNLGGAPSTPGGISGPDSVCANSTHTFGILSVNGATSYTWTLPNGWTGSSTTTNISATQGTGPGTITVTANNSCGSSSPQSLAVTIISAIGSLGNITGPDSACPGSPTTFSVSPVTGATSYTWTLPANWSGSSSASSIQATPASNGGNVTVVANNACGSTSSQSLAVNLIPGTATPGAITGPTNICNGVSATYSAAPVSGATSYTWTLPGTWTGSSSVDSISATAGTTGGNISVTANGTCGSSVAQTLAVTNSGAPVTPGGISGPDSVCDGSTHTFGILAVGGATDYTWTLPNGWTGSSTTTNISATEGTGPGTISVTANNGCGSSTPQSIYVSILTVPSALGSITGPTSACETSINTYSVSPVSGATSYTWTLPGGWSGLSTADSISATLGASSGDVMVTANNACGSTSPQSLNVTVSPVPATPTAITGPTSACDASTNVYSVAPVGGATSYTWTLPGTWTGSSSTDSISALTNSPGGTVSVTANGTCGSSAPQTLAVTVSSTPSTPGTINGPDSVCPNSTNTFAVATVSGATVYTWTLPNGWTGTSTTETISATQGTGVGTISVTSGNTCGTSSPQTLSVTLASGPPSTPGTIAQSSSVCSGGLDTFSIATVSGATSYTWSLPNSWTGTSTTENINTTAGSGGGTVSVTANNFCGSSSAQTLSVSFSGAPATPGTISGPDSVCSGSSNTYAIVAVSGATSYTWSLPNGWTGTSSTENINTTAGSGAGTFSVTANNSCGSSAPQTLTVNLASAPATPATISGPDSVCNNSSNTYAVTSVSGATSYTWSLPNGWTGTSTTESITATVSGAGTISVTANNACGSSTAQTLAVNLGASAPATPGTINGPDSVCTGSSNTYAVTAVNGATSYTWTFPNGWTGTSTSASITATAGAAGGTVLVTANNSCGSSTPQTTNVNVGHNPQVAFNFAHNPVCSNLNPTVTLNSGTPAGGSYSGQGVTGTTFDASSLSSGNYVLTYSYTNGFGCTGSDTALAVVTVCSGIENTDAEQISVYPNPFNNAIIINTKGSYGRGIAILLDATGRELNRLEFDGTGSFVQINTGSLANGAYLLSILVDGKTVAIKKLFRME